MLDNLALRSFTRAVLLLLSALLAPVAGAAESRAASECRSIVLNDEEAEAVCVLPTLQTDRAVRFQALFLGSHDDSLVSLRLVTLDGAPISCKEGSKTESRFEDGDVTLEYAVTSPAPRSGGELKVKIAMHHLQLHKTELLID
ncbi:MAG: hypothetical protein V3V71_15945 [Roseateles sp.]